MLVLFSCLAFLMSRSYSSFCALFCFVGLLLCYLRFDSDLSFGYLGLDFGLFEASLLLDDLAMWFAGLTVLCFLWIILNMYTKHSMSRVVDVLVLYLFVCSLVFFLCGELLVLYTAFELTTLPILAFVGLLGVSSRRVYAISVMVVYVLFSSIVLAVVLYMYLDEVQDAQHFYISVLRGVYGADQWVFVLFVLIFFAVKVPVFPFYIWLPEAHVESNTEMSILLASIVLKFGAFGLIRVGYWIDSDHINSVCWFAVAVCLIGLVHSCVSAILHLDMKKLVAYSSIAHMQFGLIGVFACDSFGLLVVVLGLLVHGVVSIGLFYSIGVASECIGTRHIAFVHAGVALTPILSFIGLVTVLLNISVPLSMGAIVELLTLSVWHSFGLAILVISALCAVWGCCLFSLVLLYRVFMADSSWWSADTVDVSANATWAIGVSYLLLVLAVWLL